jgi:glycosyltransferase involved in cell wall biosynthesis
MTRKACLVGPAYPYRGGISHFTTVLTHEFEKDHEVLVVNFKRLYPSFLFPGKTQYDESKSPVSVESARTIDSLDPFSFWKTARTIARFEPDLVVFQWWQPFFGVAYFLILWFLKRFMRGKPVSIVILCHNVLPHESSPVDRMLIKIGFRQASSFLVHSTEDEANLRRLKKDPRVRVHPLPVFDMFRHGGYTKTDAKAALGIEGRIVLFFGYVRDYKGLNILLDGFAGCAGRIDATLMIVGEFYGGKENYIAKIDQLGIADRVIVVDQYVPNEEVEKYFAACDVVALPYLSATQSAIVQVAYSFDKPVIVTRVGGLPEVVEDGSTGFVVPPRDPGAVGDALVKFFEASDPAVMEKNIKAAKERFSWGGCKRALLELDDSVGASHTRNTV